MVRYNVDEASMPAGSRFESGVVQGIWFDKALKMRDGDGNG